MVPTSAIMAIEAKSLGENNLAIGDMQVQLSASKAASRVPPRSNALGVKNFNYFRRLVTKTGSILHYNHGDLGHALGQLFDARQDLLGHCTGCVLELIIARLQVFLVELRGAKANRQKDVERFLASSGTLNLKTALRGPNREKAFSQAAFRQRARFSSAINS
jgi:hypothetical protein